VDLNHNAYAVTTCQNPYSLSEGEMCPQDIPANQLYLGEANQRNNSNPISFCATGPCIQRNGIHRCASADYTYAGDGCRQSNECGRGMQCACPAQGGARQRCLIDSAHQGWEQGREEWFQVFQPWFSCLENNQCTLNNNRVGSCGRTYCEGVAQLKPATTCTTDYPFQLNVPNYHGYAATMNIGSHLVPSFFIILLGIIYALVH